MRRGHHWSLLSPAAALATVWGRGRRDEGKRGEDEEERGRGMTEEEGEKGEGNKREDENGGKEGSREGKKR